MEESKSEEERISLFQKQASEFLDRLGAVTKLPETSQVPDFYSDLIRGILKVRDISPGRVSCSFLVKSRISNFYNGLHGGAVAAIAERVCMACARTLVSEEKPLFLGELSVSYLTAASVNTELVVVGKVVRSGRNLTVISAEFRIKDSEKLVYAAQATFFNVTPSKL